LARLDVAQPALLMVEDNAYKNAILPLKGNLPGIRNLLYLGSAPPDGCDDLGQMMVTPCKIVTHLEPSPLSGLLHFTSGTTAKASVSAGQPRAILHSQSIEDRLVQSGVEAFGLKNGEMIWCTGEPGWALHSACGIILPLAVGAAILLDEIPVTPSRCLELLQGQPIDVWYTTPTIIRGMMGLGTAMVKSAFKRRLRLAASVGEPLSADVVEWSACALGIPFRDSWWQTETGGVVLAHPLDKQPAAGSMGRPLHGVEIKLVERDGGNLIFMPDSGEETGEIALRNDLLAPWKAVGGEQGAPEDAIDGWHLTHDLARRDGQGNFWFLGRDDEVINMSGRMVGPFEIESVMMAHPAVAEIGVVGWKDAQNPECAIAFVGLNPGFDPVPALREELMNFALEHLGSVLAPAEIRFEFCLPRTPSGKILRRSLKAKLQPLR
jgi:acetyl-CoA synthetase